MKHIVSFSTGLSSALTADRVIERYGKQDTVIVFMDTNIEDHDNYRFMYDCEDRWDIKILTLTNDRTPYQVFEDQSIIANQKIAPCTFKLKIDPFMQWLEGFKKAISAWGEELCVHIGFDHLEPDRMEKTKANYNAAGYDVDFPLMWRPIEWGYYPDVVRHKWGIEPPRMYTMGYTHANCGGRCVKQGQGDWIRTLINFPERYREIEEWEQMMRDHPVRKDYAICRDQTGGTVKPLTLKELRERYEADSGIDLRVLDMKQGSCVHCGVGDFVNKQISFIHNESLASGNIRRR